ncbi:hypothetical protein [Candidatus Lokiarchaeum ossiferum]|uniref:hypothetical protein n=1 Tax=Candidatus Lokiarchaeum ossiferum TaxID=2951803 RepID=UPI00352BFB0E
MKIPGSFFEVQLVLNGELIEFQILNRAVVEYQISVMDFEEIEFDLPEFLEENHVSLPKNRLENVLQQLEGVYLELQQQQEKIRHQQMTQYQQSQQNIITYESQKVLLMGSSGKSSIYQVIFESKSPYETFSLPPTKKVIKHNIEFAAMTSASRKQNLAILEAGSEFPAPEHFDQASILLFIIDAFEVSNYENIRYQLHQAIKLLKYHGKRPAHLQDSQSNIFCFIHKMDLFPNSAEQFESLVKYFRYDPEADAVNLEINFFPTSIFDSSIYSAWAKVVEVMMPKSSKLNALSNQLKEALGLYATLIIEKRTGLPICASKTLLDDSVLVGSTNRVLIAIEKVLPEYELAGLKDFRINTATGVLEVKLFHQYYMLVLLYPPHINLNDVHSQKKLTEFIETMLNSI